MTREKVERAARRLGIEQLHPEQEQVLRDIFAGRGTLHYYWLFYLLPGAGVEPLPA